MVPEEGSQAITAYGLVIGTLILILLYFFSRSVLNSQKEKEVEEYEDEELVSFFQKKLIAQNVAKNKKAVAGFFEKNYKNIRLDFNYKTNQPLYVVADRNKLLRAITKKYLSS